MVLGMGISAPRSSSNSAACAAAFRAVLAHPLFVICALSLAAPLEAILFIVGVQTAPTPPTSESTAHVARQATVLLHPHLIGFAVALLRPVLACLVAVDAARRESFACLVALEEHECRVLGALAFRRPISALFVHVIVNQEAAALTVAKEFFFTFSIVAFARLSS